MATDAGGGGNNNLPKFIHRIDVVRILGIDYHAVDDLRHEMREGEEVPAGKIGARRGLSRRRGRKGAGYFLYRASDVLRLAR